MAALADDQVDSVPRRPLGVLDERVGDEIDRGGVELYGVDRPRAVGPCDHHVLAAASADHQDLLAGATQGVEDIQGLDVFAALGRLEHPPAGLRAKGVSMGVVVLGDHPVGRRMGGHPCPPSFWQRFSSPFPGHLRKQRGASR